MDKNEFVSSSSPRKKLKLDDGTHTAPSTASAMVWTDPEVLEETLNPSEKTVEDKDGFAERDKEIAQGITEFVSYGTQKFAGYLKTRYNDFIVNEILKDGTVVRLTELHVDEAYEPKDQPPAQSSDPKGVLVDFSDPAESVASKEPANRESTLKTVVNRSESSAGTSRFDAAVERPGEKPSTRPSKPTTQLASGSQQTGADKQSWSLIDFSEPSPLAVPSAPVDKHLDLSAAQSHATPSKTIPDLGVTSSVEAKLDTSEQSHQEAIKSHGDIATKTKSESEPRVEEASSSLRAIPKFTLNPTDQHILDELFGPSKTSALVDLMNKPLVDPHQQPSSHGSVKTDKIDDKSLRTRMHLEIRRIFNGKLDTTSQNECITISISNGSTQRKSKGQSRGGQRGGRGGQKGPDGHTQGTGDSDFKLKSNLKKTFKNLGGPHIHFTMHKAGKDTMEILSFLARRLGLRPNDFSFLGTKDRRAMTSQRVSVRNVFAQRLFKICPHLFRALIGNYKYEPKPLELGDLYGNQFQITLRDCRFPNVTEGNIQERARQAEDIVKRSMKYMENKGFVNYFGLQRFGTFRIGTDEIGKRLLQGDFDGAIDGILDYNPDILPKREDDTVMKDETSTYELESMDLVPQEDRDRAIAIHNFRTTGSSEHALKVLPKKFAAEAAIIEQMDIKNQFADAKTGFKVIPSKLRSLYVHAYQSKVWNFAASHRWKTYGKKVLPGDLILLRDLGGRDKTLINLADRDEDGEEIVRPANEDRAVGSDERFERARPLTAKEVASGEFTIFDIVLPCPGFDILYPSYMMDFYEDLMARPEFGGLSPHKMRRNERGLHAPGSYRRLIARPTETSVHVRVYRGQPDKFVDTDADRLIKSRLAGKGTKAHEDPIVQLVRRTMGTDIRIGGADIPIGRKRSRGVKHKAKMAAKLHQNKRPKTAHEPADVEMTYELPANDQPTVAEEGGAWEEDEESEEEDLDNIHPTDTQSMMVEGRSTARDARELEMEDHEAPSQHKLAVIMSMKLESSVYATMALRELTKMGVEEFKPDFMAKR